MIKTLEDAIDRVRALPADRQQLAAELLEQIAAPVELHVLSDLERAGVKDGLAELDRGDHANKAAIRAVFEKYRL
jgi:predicted transcriptional regulator